MPRLENQGSNAMPLGANEPPYAGPAPTYAPPTFPPTPTPLPQMGVYGYDQNGAAHPWDQSQQGVLAQGQWAMGMPPEKPSDWTVPAILACFCCFWPAGIAAIRAASKANAAYEIGDYEGAKEHAASAKLCTIISIVIGLFLNVGVIAYFVVKVTHDNGHDNEQWNTATAPSYYD